MKLKYEFVVRSIMDEYVVIPQGEGALQFSGMITTNEVGACLWEGLSADTREEQLVAELLERFDVEEACARADVAEFLAQLRRLNLLEE